MSDDEQKKQPEVEEVVTDFGEVRVRSGFEVEEVEPGVVSVNLFGPVFEVDDLDDEEEQD
jgi:hypothetical protein